MLVHACFYYMADIFVGGNLAGTAKNHNWPLWLGKILENVLVLYRWPVRCTKQRIIFHARLRISKLLACLVEEAEDNILLRMLNTWLACLDEEAVENIILHMRIADLICEGNKGKYYSAHVHFWPVWRREHRSIFYCTCSVLDWTLWRKKQWKIF